MVVQFFDVHDLVAVPTAQLLAIPDYAEISDRDHSLKKERAVREFSFIFFMVSMTRQNPFRAYNEGVKSQKIIERLFPEENWTPDAVVIRQCKQYKRDIEMSLMTYSMIVSSKIAIEKVKYFYENVDLDERNTRTGSLLYKPKDVTGAIRESIDLMRQLTDLEKKITEEELSGNKADKEANYFEE